MGSHLAGKRCLVVGASSGIGAAVALRFGALGARLVVHCNDNRDGAHRVRRPMLPLDVEHVRDLTHKLAALR